MEVERIPDGHPGGYNFILRDGGNTFYRFVKGDLDNIWNNSANNIRKHRLDGPSEVYANGELGWCQDDKYHRLDGPAVSKPNGYECWVKRDQIHREGGPACTYPDGTKYWFFEGKKHRLDAPAIEFPTGAGEWWNYDNYVGVECNC